MQLLPLAQLGDLLLQLSSFPSDLKQLLRIFVLDPLDLGILLDQLLLVLLCLVLAESHFGTLVGEFESQLFGFTLEFDERVTEVLGFLLHLRVGLVDYVAVLVDDLDALGLKLGVKVFEVLDLFELLVVLELV